MKTRIFALALAGALSCANMPLHAAEYWSPLKMKPKMAASLDEGDKHVVGYFLQDGDACKLTLMIADLPKGAGVEQPDKPSRLVLTVSSGRSAKLDTV